MDITKIQSSYSLTIEQVIKDINNSGFQFAVIVRGKKVIGIITDGDIRRCILEKVDLMSSIQTILRKDFIFSLGTPSQEECKNSMIKNKVNFLPILNDEMYLQNIIFLNDLISDSQQKLEARPPIFILAGGFGTRMAPLTDNVPKPMLKINGIPLLEIILDRFTQQGFRNFYIATHYLSHQIKEYFKSGLEKNINIHYLQEDSPLGTAGSLSLLGHSLDFKNIIVVNGDLLNKVDFNELYKFHMSKGASITMATKMYRHEIPYGVVRYENSDLKAIDEKPKVDFQVNAGIYVVNNEVIRENIQGVEYLDMPDLINQVISKNKIVSIFPIYEYWNDIGAKEDFARAQIDFKNQFKPS